MINCYFCVASLCRLQSNTTSAAGDKGMVVPFLIKQYATKAFGGLEVQLRTFLTPAL